MNKLHRRIHRNNVAFLKKLSTQIASSSKVKYPYAKLDKISLGKVPLSTVREEMKKQDLITEFYTSFLRMPSQAASHVLNAKSSKLQGLAFMLRKEQNEMGSWYRPWGSVFSFKFPICVWAKSGIVNKAHLENLMCHYRNVVLN